jgi:hypothetical protein
MTTHEHYVGVDVGLQNDFTALAVLRAVPQPEGLPQLHVVDLQRTRGRTFLQIGAEVQALAGHLGRCAVAVDATGVGEGVWQELRRNGTRPVGIVIGSGHRVTGGPLRWNVPASTLYETAYRVFVAGRYRIARSLPLAENLIRELQLVSSERSDNGSVRYTMPRTEEGHGDVAMAVMLATLVAEREAGRSAVYHHPQQPRERPRPQGRPRAGNTAPALIRQRRDERGAEARAYAEQERERWERQGWGTARSRRAIDLGDPTK